MPAKARHLHGLADARPRACRTASCPFEGTGALGFCPACEAVYRAALELRERLLARRGAQLRAARPALFEGMAPDMRARLLAHIAAQSAHRGRPPSVLDLCGLEDFLAELRELGFGDLT